MNMAHQLWARDGGSGEPVLLLLHGIGSTADVWNTLLELISCEWRARWLARTSLATVVHIGNDLSALKRPQLRPCFREKKPSISLVI